MKNGANRSYLEEKRDRVVARLFEAKCREVEEVITPCLTEGSVGEWGGKTLPERERKK